MNDLENKNKELMEAVASYKGQLDQLIIEQQNAAKLLIRRDLALSRANEQLQSLDIAKSEFISIAAHQLRTPLSAIKWIVSMLSEDEFKDKEERQLFIGKAAQSTDRMISLVNDLLEADHIQSGKDQFVFTSVDIVTLVTSVVSEMQAIADNRNVRIVLDLAAVGFIRGDVMKLRALFQNLIENAIKYTPPGGKIRISARLEVDFVKVIVADSGIGIPDDQKINIFSKFFRAENAKRTDTVGSGLGLFIAKQVVERHGGKLWFESKVGAGSSFFATLPSILGSDSPKVLI